MKPEVDKVASRDNLGNREAARMRDDQRRAMLAQLREHRLGKTRLMAKFHREPDAILRGVAEEILDAPQILVVAFEAGRELQQDGPEFMLQSSCTFEKLLPRLLHIIEPLDVGDV